jgi:hypothetical protein
MWKNRISGRDFVIEKIFWFRNKKNINNSYFAREVKFIILLKYWFYARFSFDFMQYVENKRSIIFKVIVPKIYDKNFNNARSRLRKRQRNISKGGSKNGFLKFHPKIKGSYLYLSPFIQKWCSNFVKKLHDLNIKLNQLKLDLKALVLHWTLI